VTSSASSTAHDRHDPVTTQACVARHLLRTLQWTGIATELPKLSSRVGPRHREPQRISDAYLEAWLRIFRGRPATHFYCYTKEVTRFRNLVEPDPPPNFRWTFSYGGTQDHLITPDDRVTDVFPDSSSIAASGFTSQEVCNTIAATGPDHIGIPANNISHFRVLQGDRRFSQWQAEADAARPARRRAA
jgi:hypothetical protein